jgi:hypothetical protein
VSVDVWMRISVDEWMRMSVDMWTRISECRGAVENESV